MPSSGEPRNSGSSRPTIVLDSSKILPRSSTGAPTSSQITYSGSGAAMSVTKSASPRGTTSSISSSQISLMCLASRPIIRGVNPRLTKLRCRVCCGGSMFSIISRCMSIWSSGVSLNSASRW